MNKIRLIWGFLFHHHEQSVFKRLRWIILLLIVYSIAAIFIENELELHTKIDTINLGQFHLIFSFVLTIIIAFRVNAAYARWWEARGQWGVIVNNSRNLALKFNNFIGFVNDPHFKNCLEAFSLIAKYNLRGEHFKCANLPMLLLAHMHSIINNYRNKDKIRIEQYMVLDVHIVNLIDSLGVCEKIKNTSIPRSFSIFVKQALFFYILVFPFGWLDKFGILIVPMLIVIIYILMGLEMLAEDLEEPFGTDFNDLKLEDIVKTIQGNIKSISG